MKKRFFALAIATLALSACGLKSPETTTTAANSGETTAAKADSGSEGAEVTLVYAEVNPLDTIVGQSGTAFKEKVEELSGGKIHIDVQASGVLGSENDVLDGMLGGTGTVDMSRISAFALQATVQRRLRFFHYHTHLTQESISGSLLTAICQRSS